MSDVRDRRLFDHDPFTGVTEYFHYDPETDGFTIESTQDIEPLLEWNREVRNMAPTSWGDGKIVATWPAVITHQLMQDGIWGDPDRMRVWLNSDAAKPFRNRPGKI